MLDYKYNSIVSPQLSYFPSNESGTNVMSSIKKGKNKRYKNRGFLDQEAP